jgi:hypothetical protein
MILNQDNISILRSVNQQIVDPKFSAAKEIAFWMGALQAQDYQMSKWAFGSRLQNSTETDINKEIDSGGIIRTHLMRPTWHFVSSEDIRWILELTAPRIKSSMKTRDKQLELTESIYLKCNTIIERSLKKEMHLTREELISELRKAKIDVDNNRAAHILLRAELDGLVCSGKQKGQKPTYTILAEWAKENNKYYRDEALRELARRYFISHGPASIQDFTWWSGLTSTDSKLALELSKSSLISETIKDQTYWFADSFNNASIKSDEILFLPAFDEFMISYTDRSASLPLLNKNAISANGIFYPIIVVKGKVTGLWKRNIKKDKANIEIRLFKPGRTSSEITYKKALTKYSNFIGKKIELIIEK